MNAACCSRRQECGSACIRNTRSAPGRRSMRRAHPPVESNSKVNTSAAPRCDSARSRSCCRRCRFPSETHSGRASTGRLSPPQDRDAASSRRRANRGWRAGTAAGAGRGGPACTAGRTGDRLRRDRRTATHWQQQLRRRRHPDGGRPRDRRRRHAPRAPRAQRLVPRAPALSGCACAQRPRRCHRVQPGQPETRR